MAAAEEGLAQDRGDVAKSALGIVADPAPLGLAAFALTTFVLSMFNAGFVDEKGEPIVFGLALAYGGGAQLLAGMWAFREGNTFAATAFTSFGAFWLSFWAFNQFYAKTLEAEAGKAVVGDAVGLFLIAWGIFTAYMFIGTLRLNLGLVAVFGLLAATFFVLGFAETSANMDLTKIGGYLGIATAVAAWFASFADMINSVTGRTTVPLGELGNRT